MKHTHFSLPKDSKKMNAEVVKAEFGHTQALGMKRSNEKRCPAEEVSSWSRLAGGENMSFGSKFFVWPHLMSRGILIPQPGIEPTPAAAEAQSPTTGLPGKSWKISVWLAVSHISFWFSGMPTSPWCSFEDHLTWMIKPLEKLWESGPHEWELV